MILSKNFFIFLGFLFINNIITNLTIISFNQFNQTFSFTTRTIRWLFKFWLSDNWLFLSNKLFSYQFIIVFSNNFLIFSNLNTILNLILSPQRFWSISKSYYIILIWLDNICFIFDFYVLITIHLHMFK